MTSVSEAPRILVVDDDRDIRELLAAFLARQGMSVRTMGDGQGLPERLERDPVDLVVLDLNLPFADGLAVCRAIRQRGLDTPVIMLTARSDPVDRVVGLEIGADDYVAKPFEPRELAARIRTVLRRIRSDATATGSTAKEGAATAAGAGRLRFAGWVLDIPARELVSPEGTVVVLTSGEFRLLRILAEHAGRVLSRDQLLQQTQGRDATGLDRSIDLHVSRLRVKLRDDGKNPRLLKTVRNEGYVLAVPVETGA